MGIFSAILDFLYPPHCPICHSYVEERGSWCAGCLAKTVCVQRLVMPAEFSRFIASAYALGHYRGSLQDLILGLKLYGKKENISYIRTFLDACEVGKLLSSQMLAVPVPLHAKKEKERGFNQVELIFRDWLECKGISFQHLLVRKRATAPQYELNPEERRKNLKDAFEVKDASAVYGREILLLDDIMTTGTTAMACAEVLRRAGAKKVNLLVLASDHRG